MSYMSSTTCTYVHSRESHDTNLSGQFFLASVIQSLKFLCSRISDLYFFIFPDSLIHFLLDFCQLSFIQHTIQIYSDHITSHMETYIIITILCMDNTTDHMLPRMLLHQIKTTCPVNLSFNLHTHFQSLVRIMEQFTILLMNLCYLRITQSSYITRLTAAFRIESTLVQNYCVAFFPLSALYNGCCEFFFIYIFII